MDDLQSYLAREAEKDKGQTLEGSVKLGVQENPEAYAKTLQLAAKTGMAPEAVKASLPEVEAADRLRSMNLADLLAAAPKTAAWISNPDHAAIAHDDLDTLRLFENASSRAKNFEDQRVAQLNRARGLTGFGGVLRSLGARLVGGMNELIAMPGEVGKTLSDATIGRMLGPGASQWAMETLNPIGAFTAKLGRGGAQTMKPYQRETPSMDVRDPLTGEEFWNPRAIGFESAANLLAGEAPSMAAMAGLTALTGGAAAPLAVAKYGKFLKYPAKALSYALKPAALVEVGRTIQGQRESGIQELMGKKGITREQAEIEVAPGALLAGVLSFGVAAPMEAKILEDLLHTVAKAPGGQSLARRGLARLMAAGSTGAKEGFQEVLNGIGEDTAAWLTYNPDKTFRQAAVNAAENFFGGFVMGGAMGGALHQQNYSQEFFQALADGATNSKLLKRMPEKFQEAVQTMVKDGPVENLRISPDAFQTYYQTKGMDPAEVAASLGVPNYMEASLSGNDLLIPTGAYATQIAGTEDHAELSKDLKMAEGQMSAREMEAAKAGGEEVIRAAQEVDAETQAKPEFQAMKDEMKARYIAVGESPAVAETYAMDMAKVYHRMATRAGMNPSELFAQYAPKIVRGEAPKPAEVIKEMFTPETFPDEGVSWEEGDQVFFQSAYHGSPYRFDKFSLEHMGKGEGNQAYGWGLYFAGQKATAEWYRQTLADGSNQRSYEYKGQTFQPGTPEWKAVGTIKNDGKRSAVKLFKEMLEDAKDGKDYTKENGVEFYQRMLDLAESHTASDKIKELKGQTYEVDIPNDGAYLLWDKPLSEQPGIAKAIKKLLMSEVVEQRALDDFDVPTKGNLVHRIMGAGAGQTGQDVYGSLSDVFRTDEGASKALASAGIAGIKYLDGSSRSAGEGNFNYVVFDDNAVKITQTFYQSGKPQKYQGPMDQPIPKGIHFDDLSPEHQQRVVSGIENAIQAWVDNPEEFKRQYREREDTRGGRLVNGDIINAMIPTVAENIPLGLTAMKGVDSAIQMQVITLHKELRQQAYDIAGDLPIAITAGGQASGKTTLAEYLIDDGVSGAVIDAPNDDARTVERYLAEIKGRGKDAQIVYVDRPDFRGAYRSMLIRATREGRVVPLDDMISKHLKVPGEMLKVAESNRNNPRVSLFHAIAAENTQPNIIGGPLSEDGKDAAISIRNRAGLSEDDLAEQARETYITYLKESENGNPAAPAISPDLQREIWSSFPGGMVQDAGIQGGVDEAPGSERGQASDLQRGLRGAVGPLSRPRTFKPVDTNSPEFKVWFGHSKVVDASGAPLRVLHGTSDSFDTFSSEKIGQTYKVDKRGFFFTNDSNIANNAAIDSEYSTGKPIPMGGRQIIPVFLRANSPLILKTNGHPSEYYDENSKSILRKVKRGNHDSVIIIGDGGSTNYIVFDASQIKSSISNVGSFDPNNTSILYQQKDDFSFGSKNWQEYYRGRLGKNARAKGDQAERARKGMAKAATAEGQAAFDFGREASAREEEEAFLRFDKGVERIAKPAGWFSRSQDGTFVIGKTPDGDFSTFIHEPAHAYLEMFKDLAQREGASEGIKSDAAKILAFLKVDAWEKIGTPEHELWARANEVYAREGKAPSQELRGVFARFKVWLQAVYRHVQELDAPLSDDIRGVFDRMRATDEEIEIAHAEVSGPQLFQSAEEAGMTEKEFIAYATEKGLGKEEAKAELLAKLNETAVREKSQDWKREESEVRSAVTEMVDAMPDYRAIRVLRKGALEDGTPFSLNRGELVREFGEDRVKELQGLHRNLYRLDGIMDAGAAAEILGFDSGELLMQAIEAAPKRSAAIAQETQRVMTERHGDIRFDGTIEDQARQAVANDARTRALHRELTALRNKAQTQGEAKAEAKTQARAALAIPPAQTFREAATAMVEQKPILNLDANGYLNGQRKYSREAYKKATQGKFQEAADAKQKELLNHFLYLEAVKAKAEAEKIAAYGKRLGKDPAQQRIGKAQGVYLDQINGLLERFDFSRMTNKAIQEEAQTLAQFVASLPEGADAVIEPHLLDERYRKNYREMSLTELRAVRDALKNIEALARQEREFMLEGKAVAFETAITEMVETARKNNKAVPLVVDPEAEGRFKKARKRMQAMDAGLKKVEWLIDHLDGGDINGPWRRYIFNPIAQAQYKEKDLHDRIGSKLIQAMDEMPKQQRLSLLDTMEIPGIGTVTRKYAITAALNMGNESNMEKMVTGMGWAGDVLNGSPQLDALLGKLTSQDWAFAQKVWDGINELWPEIVDLEKRTTGVVPPKVEARAFTVQTSDGKSVRLEGGYFPIAYDPKKSTQGKKQEAGTPLDQLFESGYTKASTAKGHTKERVAFSAPLLMDFEKVTTRHTAGVIKDISHREAAMAINKMLMNQDIRSTVQETMGEAYEAMLLPWLRGVVNDSNMGMDGMAEWDTAASRLRSNVVIAGLGFRVSSVLVQASDWVRATDRVKTRHLGGAILKFSMNPAEMIRTVRALSPEMAGRPQNLDRDLRNEWKRLMGKEGWRPAVQRFAMTGLAMADAVTSITTWWGAYQQALEGGSPQNQAIAEADRTVRLALMTGATKDQAAIQRRKDFGFKFATMFMGDATSVYGILGDVQHKMAKGQDVPKQAARLVFSLMLPAILAELIKGRGPGDDEDKAWWTVRKGLMAFPSSIPILRDVVGAMESGRDYQFSPVVGAMNKVARAGEADWKLLKGDEKQTTEDAFIHSLDAAAVLFGLPISQAVTTGKYFSKVSSGEETPESNTELVKNALLGSKPQKK